MKDILDYANTVVFEAADDLQVKFNDFAEQIKAAFKEAKYTLGDKSAAPKTVGARESDTMLEYNILFFQKERKSDTDTGAYLMVNITACADKSKEYVAGVYVKLAWSNGKRSYSIYSNVHQAKRYELDFGEVAGHSLLQGWAGGIEYYKCTPEVASKIIDGIKGLKYSSSTFEDCGNKARFTDQAWDKCKDEINYIFKPSKKGYDQRYSNYPWNAK